LFILAALIKLTYISLEIAITGASGHVGANLIRELIPAGHHIKVLFFNDDRSFAGLPVTPIKGDLLDPSAVDELIKGTELVFHLAAQISITGDKDGKVFMINTEGTRNVCESCMKNNVRRLVHFSSIHAFNAKPFEGILDENRKMVDDTAFRYDYSKLVGQNIVMEYVKKGLDAVILNPTCVIGPMDYKPSLMGQVFTKLYNRQLPALVKGGYDFVDVRDVAHAAILASEKGRKGQWYLISNTWKHISELAKMVEDITGKKPPRFTTPNWLAIAALPFLNLYARIKKTPPIYTKESLDVLKNAHRNVSNQKAREELGFNPRPLEETIRDIYKWFNANHSIK
jgi:dihydroflavonol-4-reductase